MNDICPIMSIGKSNAVDCTPRCAWFDTEYSECALSRINANLKCLEDVSKNSNETTTAISQLDNTITDGIGALIRNL